MKKKIYIALLLAALSLTGCKSDIDPVPLGAKQRDRGEYVVDRQQKKIVNGNAMVLVMHYTALDDEKSLRVLTGGKVSVHYLVPSNPKKEKGKPVVIHLLPEDAEAWHAGKSFWRGKEALNSHSVGIEIVNKGYTDESDGTRKWYRFNQSQIDLIIPLAKDIMKRHKMLPYNIVAHSDVAPQRKHDPGPLFPWAQLAKAGVGAWPNAKDVKKHLSGRPKGMQTDTLTMQKLLARYGYQVPVTGDLDKETKNVIAAFQMHFRPSNFKGMPDAETEAILKALIEKYKIPPA